jgi:hypothetical protein
MSNTLVKIKKLVMKNIRTTVEFGEQELAKENSREIKFIPLVDEFVMSQTLECVFCI